MSSNDLQAYVAQVQARQQADAQALAQLQQTAQQSNQMFANSMAAFQAVQGNQTPQVQPIGQPNSSAIVYCRDLTGNLIACRQVH
jgi:hypothetical protein